MKSLFLFCTLALFYPELSHAQTINVKRLDSLFDKLQNRGMASGSVAISKNGKIAYQRAIGFSLIDSNKIIKPDTNSKYRIGSVSKMFTAVMIFQLIDEKKLRLDEKLATYYPQLPSASKISIKDMLYHRSGLHDYTNDTNFPDWMSAPKTHEEMLQLITEKGTDFEPGTKAVYSNTNYLLLSYIIETICKMPYSQALEKRITSKIKLQNTYYGKHIDSNKNESTSYKYSDSTWRKEKETDLSIHNGAGSIVSTPLDLTVLIQSLFTGKLISRTSLDNMKTMIDYYGMGMFPYDFETIKGYGHNGRIEEFYSAVRYYPEEKLAVSYITNGILYPRIDILQGILKICFNKDYTIPFSIPNKMNDTDLNQYLGVYSSGALPFKIICKKENNHLVFDAAGKTMEAEFVATDYFMNINSGSFFEFFPGKGELHVKETDNVYILQKE